MNSRHSIIIGLILVSLATVGVYFSSLRGGFVYDDHWAIQKNVALERAPFLLFWTDPDTGADPDSGLTHDVYRPLTVLSFALSSRLWGNRLLFWRLENLIWHLLNGILFVLLLRRLGFRWGPGLVAACAVFLLHPLQVSSVAWIYQRSTLISAAGCLAALLVSVGTESFSGWRLAASVFFLVVGLFTKESAVVFPVLFWMVSEKKLKPSCRRLYLGCYVVCVAAFLSLRALLLGGWSQIADMPRGWAEKGVLTLIALPQYAAKFLIPWDLRASYDLPSPSPVRLLTAAVGLLLLGFYFYRLFRRRTDSGWLFGLWALMALAPMLPLAPIRAFFAERFFYLSAMGAAALVGLWIERHRRWRIPAGLWLLLLSIVTARYAAAWRSDASLWSWTVQGEPSNAFAQMCLAENLSDPAQAQTHYLAALANHPSPAMTLAAWNNLAVLALRQQQPAKALYWTAQILKSQPDAPQALYNRWRALKALGNNAEAKRLREGLIKDPRVPRRLLGS